MTGAKRTRMTADDRRAQLVGLGLELLTDRTLEELSIEALADAAGVSRGLLFHYFSGKTEFHLAVLRAAADDLIARTEPDPDWPAEEALGRSLEAFVGYVEDNPRGYVTLVRGAASGDEAMRAVFEGTRDRLAARTVDALVALGLPVDPATALAVRGWIAFCEDVVVNWLAGGAPPSRGDVLRLLARALPALVLGADVPADLAGGPTRSGFVHQAVTRGTRY